MKRSTQIALLLMGTTTVGAGAYTLMPRNDCGSPSAEAAAVARGDAPPCGSSRGSSGGSSGGSGGSSGRSYFSSGRDGGSASGTTSEPGATSRGGFGSFARSIGSHFSFGG